MLAIAPAVTVISPAAVISTTVIGRTNTQHAIHSTNSAADTRTYRTAHYATNGSGCAAAFVGPLSRPAGNAVNDALRMANAGYCEKSQHGSN